MKSRKFPVSARVAGLTAIVMAAVLGLGSAIAADEGASITKVNGSIDLQAHGSAGELKNVNGSIRVGEGAQVEAIKSVNGSVTIGDGARVSGDVKSVNGGVDMGADSQVGGDLKTVNGHIATQPGAVVSGAVKSANGTMELKGARAGSIETTNSDIELSDGTVVLGDLIVHKPDSGLFHFGNDSKPPHIVIGENCEVRGELNFEREVYLEVADSAKIGKITGVQPIKD